MEGAGKAFARWAEGGLRLPLAAAALALALYAVLLADDFGLRVLAIAGIFALLVIGYQFIFGHAGALSLAQGAFFGLGAYATAIVGARYGLALPATLAVSIVVPTALALVIALPVLRLESHYFALATLGISQVVWLAAVNFESVTGGSNGMAGIPGFELFGVAAGRGWGELAVVWAAVALGGLLAWQLVRGLYGLGFRVMRAEPLAAAAAGINASGLRLTAFLLSAAYGGAAGALHAHVIRVVSPESLELPVLVACLTMAVVGGRTRVSGAIVGAVLLIHVPEWVRFLEDYYLIAYGAAMLLMIVVAPEGLVGALGDLRARLRPEPPAAAPRPLAIPAERRPQRGTLLEVSGVSKSFGGVVAVDDVGLYIRRSDIFGLIGPNGSGKTTLVNMITGLYRPDAGRVWFDGRDVTRWAPWRIARAGIGRTYQSPALVETMTALENVAAARTAIEGAGPGLALTNIGSDRRFDRAKGEAMAILRQLGAGDIAMVHCSALPHGLRRRVEIARALALAPDLLILDEPASGLTDGEQEQLADQLRTLTGDGLSLLIIEHNMPFLMPLVTSMGCLDEGRLISIGTPAAVRNDPLVIEAYLGAPPTSVEVA